MDSQYNISGAPQGLAGMLSHAQISPMNNYLKPGSAILSNSQSGSSILKYGQKTRFGGKARHQL